MADKGTNGPIEGAFDALGEKIKARTLELGGAAIKLTEEQLLDLTALTDDAGLALAGDKRAQAHVEAQFKLQAFSGQARAYLEGVEFRKALASALVEVAGTLVVEGAKLAAESLAGALVASA